jgi:hypothetical protein
MALCEVLARDPRYAIDVVSTIEKLDEQGFIHKVVVRGFELETDERIFAPKECDPVPLSKISGRFAGIYRFREGHGNGAKRGDRRPPISTLSAKAIPRLGQYFSAARKENSRVHCCPQRAQTPDPKSFSPAPGPLLGGPHFSRSLLPVKPAQPRPIPSCLTARLR